MSLIQIRNCSLAFVRNSEFGNIDQRGSLSSSDLGGKDAKPMGKVQAKQHCKNSNWLQLGSLGANPVDRGRVAHVRNTPLGCSNTDFLTHTGVSNSSACGLGL